MYGKLKSLKESDKKGRIKQEKREIKFEIKQGKALIYQEGHAKIIIRDILFLALDEMRARDQKEVLT